MVSKLCYLHIDTGISIMSKLGLLIIFVLYRDTEIILIQKKENMIKLQVNYSTFYFELISKPNFDITDIPVSMCK